MSVGNLIGMLLFNLAILAVVHLVGRWMMRRHGLRGLPPIRK